MVSCDAIQSVLGSLQTLLDVDYFTYCRYGENQCEYISSDDDAATQFLSCSESVMPLDAVSTNKVLTWREYCSSAYIDFIGQHYDNATSGVTFVLRHNDLTAEHISLHSSNKTRDLTQYMHSNKDLMNEVVNHIRSSINFNRHKLKFKTFSRRMVDQDNTELCDEKEMEFKSVRHYVCRYNAPTYNTQSEKN